jgi:1,4-dihydroxy-2-naphthoate octaprenyltransferase
MSEDHKMYHLLAFFRLGRPLFLIGGFILHGLGVAVALYSGAALNLPVLLWGQIGITAVQWMTHYSNDYFDVEADLANRTPTNWSGGSRVLVAGVIPARVALITALVLEGVAVVATFVLAFILQTGVLTIPLLLLSLAMAWFYSAPPLRLHSTGLGEIVSTLLVAGLVPLTGFYLQRGTIELLPVVAIIPLLCLQFCMLVAVEFPDVEGDKLVGKRTLVVQLGVERAARLYLVVLCAAYLSLPILMLIGLPFLAALSILLMSPLALWLMWCVRRGDHHHTARWNLFAFYSVALLMGTAAVEAITFLLLFGFNP